MIKRNTINISQYNFPGDNEFVEYLIKEIGVAAVPGSSYFHDPAMGRHMIRFCFCKKDETLDAAGERLMKLKVNAGV